MPPSGITNRVNQQPAVPAWRYYDTLSDIAKEWITVSLTEQGVIKSQISSVHNDSFVYAIQRPLIPTSAPRP